MNVKFWRSFIKRVEQARRNGGYTAEMRPETHVGVHLKCQLLYGFNQKWDVSTQFSIKSCGNPFSGTVLYNTQVYRRVDLALRQCWTGVYN
jgi:hypothetical protein